MRIRLKRKMARILDTITTIVAYAMFAWIDLRLAVAMAVLELSVVFGEILKEK